VINEVIREQFVEELVIASTLHFFGVPPHHGLFSVTPLGAIHGSLQTRQLNGCFTSFG
jgi:hypothetical protein